MRKIVFFASAGYAGMDTAELVELPDDTTDRQLNTISYEMAVDYADSYGIEPMENAEEGEEDEETSCGRFQRFSDNIEGWWEEYNPAKHDGLI